MEEKKYWVETTTEDLGGTQSPGLKNLFAAMAKAQSQLGVALKSATNPFFKSKYADLGEVWKACRDALTSNGIAVLQFPIHSEDDKVHLETMLCHSSGESLSRTFSMPVKDKTAQGYASVLTYLRRYSLSAIVGVVADEDDDGATASGTTKPGVGVHKATDGAKERLDKVQSLKVENLVGTVIDCFSAGQELEAFAAVEGAALDPDEKTYLWSQLDSKQRSALKKIGADRANALRNTLNA
jgi:hypothetical protein